MLNLLETLSHQNRSEDLTLLTAHDKVLVGSCRHLLIRMDLPSVGFSLTEMTEAQELLYLMLKEVSNTIVLEALEIPVGLIWADNALILLAFKGSQPSPLSLCPLNLLRAFRVVALNFLVCQRTGVEQVSLHCLASLTDKEHLLN